MLVLWTDLEESNIGAPVSLRLQISRRIVAWTKKNAISFRASTTKPSSLFQVLKRLVRLSTFTFIKNDELALWDDVRTFLTTTQPP